MGKDYSDYVCVVYGGGERVRHVEHIRQIKKDAEVLSFKYNGNTYLVNKDRAMRLKGHQPWKHWGWDDPLFYLQEMVRSKKVAALLYREPSYGPAKELIERRIPKAYVCKECGYRSEKVKAVKMHILGKHKVKEPGPLVKIEYEVQTTTKPGKAHVLEPMHINRIRQPSGRMIGDPDPAPSISPNPVLMAFGMYDGLDPTAPTFPPVVDMVSPRVMKAILDRPHFRRAYKSFRFGNLVAISQRWWIWLALAVVGIFIMLYLTGNFRV
jgi:hypothetical protein